MWKKTFNLISVPNSMSSVTRRRSAHNSSSAVQLMSKLFQPSSNQKIADLHDKEETSVNLLIQNGMIHVFSSGHIALLPTMRRSFDKLVAIIDEEMQSIGAQKVLLPTIYNTKLLKISERLDHFQDEIYMFKDKNDQSLYLAPTHEEAITTIVGNATPFGKKRLPLLLYQLDTKYRDELRPKFGLMRTKEFVMKDLYTFHNSEECAIRTYEQVCQAYLNIFSRLGLHVYKAHASTGTMGGKYSHEFLIVNKNGQDQIHVCDNCGTSYNLEIMEGDRCQNCDHPTRQEKAIEVGHTFYLGTRYSEKFKANAIVDEKLSPYTMGCYGLGVTRILGALIDNCCTTTEIRWPTILAPYDISFVLPKSGSREEKLANTSVLSDQLSSQLNRQFGLSVLIDDRGEKSIGWKIKNHQSIGIPYVVVLGKGLLDPMPTYELLITNGDDDNQSHKMTQSQLFSYLERAHTSQKVSSQSVN